jgi:hypothetical protein
MAVNDTGLNETAAKAAIENVIAGGAEIHLLTQEALYTDSATEITNNSGASVSVAEADFTVTSASGFGGTTKLELASEADFGSVDIGVVDDVAVLNSSGDAAVVANSADNPDTTGEQVSISSGEVLYEVGNV